METADNGEQKGLGSVTLWGLRSKVLAAGVLLLSSIVLIAGWGFENPSVTSFGYKFSAMVPSTALLFMLASITVLYDRLVVLHAIPQIPGIRRSTFDKSVAVIVLSVAGANLFIASNNIASGIDQFLWPHVAEFESSTMSIATSFSFLLLAACLWQMSSKVVEKHILMACATFGAMLSILALIVFAFDARSLSSAALFSTMSLPTALAFLMLFSALLIPQRSYGWMAALSGERPGSVSLRNTLPMVLILPFMLIMLTNYGIEKDAFNEHFQLSLLALGTMVVTVAILVREAFAANKLDENAEDARLRAREAEEREHEQERMRYNAELSVEAKTKFLANMSHEIRTPMNGILGFSDLLLCGELEPEQRTKIEMIHESGKTMLRLIDDILDLAKIDTGHLTVNEEVVDVRHIANSCVKMFQVAAFDKGLALKLRVSANECYEAVGDPLRLRQILTNIIGNAIKFTEKGRIEVTIRREEGTIIAAVKDTGIGIAAEQQSKVLGEFVQADESTQRRYGGSGLGLHISHKLTQLMNGSLELTSELGKGTEVTIALPAVRRLEPALPPSTSMLSEDNQTACRWQGKRIGIAEDHDINQIMITDMVRFLGAEPTIYTNGKEAIAGIESARDDGRPFDLFLMDIQMPEMDGISAVEELRSRGIGPQELTIVAMTANAFDTDISASLDAGMQAHLAKPVSIEKLGKAFAQWIPAPMT